MKKDAFYFPHFCNARHDRKIKKLIMDLGIEGYGIYFMMLEILREQQDFRYPLSDISVLAYELHTSETKIRSVICSYDLFQLDSQNNFFSVKFIYYLQPYIDKSERARVAAKKRWDKAKEIGYGNNENSAEQTEKPCVVNAVEIGVDEYFDANACANADANAMQVKESKVKESKEKKSKAKETKQFDASAYLCGLGFDLGLVTEFLANRKRKRLVNTERAFSAIVAEINKTAMDKNEVLEKIIIKGWGSFEAEWIQKSKPSFDSNLQFANYLPSSFFKAEYDCEDRIEAITKGKLPRSVPEMLNALDAVLRSKYGRTTRVKLQWN